jgi:erythronate-4-phosphate dehydrogenase
MKIIVEKNIPFIHGLLDAYATVEYLAPEAITPAAMRDADALITRTRTRCDSSLLDGSACRFIATATIGTDHIDLEYCRSHGITVANAPGCNAPAVAQYVLASVLSWLDDKSPVGLTLAVVGVGHVGSIVARWAEGLGMRVLRVDPPRAEAEGNADNVFSTLADAAREADIITFHTPLTRKGRHATYHLADADFFASLRRKPLIINSARGPIVDNDALVEALDNDTVDGAVIDCWEGEPHISPELLQRTFIATPHIAGYSREGKIRATVMALNALTAHFSLPTVTPPEANFNIGYIPEHPSAEAILASYNPFDDTAALRAACTLTPEGCTFDAFAFEALRNTYNYRPEVR